MCSQRTNAATLSPRRRPAGGPAVDSLSSCGALAAIFEGGGLGLVIPLQFLYKSVAGQRDLLPDQAVAPMLAHGLDQDRVGARFQRLAVVVLAVPEDRV